MIGKTISHYKIIEKLGEGGMGVVYKAEDTKLKRTVALKFLPPELTRNPEAKERFINEAQAASTLQHNNICTIHDIDETQDGRMFICMDYYEGETLKEKIERGPIKLENAIDFSEQVADGLLEAHKKDIVHRDIKPANIMITDKGQVKIMDFGLAKLAGQARLTKIGTTVGTVAYMSPEQVRGEEVDHRTDIWSLGVIFYEMITGELPFRGEYEQAFFYSIVNEDPKPIRTNISKQTGIHCKLEEVVDKALKKRREERYQHIDEMLSDFQNLKLEMNISIKTMLTQGIHRESRNKYTKIALPIVVALTLISFLLIKPRLFQRAIVAEPIPIVVISFENQTGEKEYDYLQKAIPNLLITSLEQSKFLRVTTWQRMYDLLRQSGKDSVELIDENLGFELCQMDDIDAIVLGSFIKAGEQFATDVKVLDVESKRILKSAQSRGEGVGSIIERQIDELSKEISRGIGLSDRNIKLDQRPIIDVNTTSLEAYNYFLRGRTEYENFYCEEATRFLERAIELDSTFAVSYLYLAWSYSALGKISSRNTSYEKAMLYAQKSTLKERLYIEAAHAGDIERDLKKQFRVLQQLADLYPLEKRVHLNLAWYYSEQQLYNEAINELNKALELDPNYGWALNLLAYSYADVGDYEKAIENFQRYAQVSPGDANPFDSMAELYFQMGKLDDAITEYKEAIAIKPDYHDAYWRLAYVYALKEDYKNAIHWIDQFILVAPSDGIRSRGRWWKGFYLYWLGNITRCLDELSLAESLATANGNEYWKSRTHWMYGWIYYDKGKFEIADKYFTERSNFLKGYRPENEVFYTLEYHFYQGVANLKKGKIDSANHHLSQIKSLLPKVQTTYVEWGELYNNLLHVEVLLAKGSSLDAVAASEKELPIDIRTIRSVNRVLYNAPFPKDGLARSLYRNGQLDKAIEEYEYLITFDPNNSKRCLIQPQYHYRLAKLYEEKGWTNKAVEQYAKFLEIWKNADEDLSELLDAKARHAKLVGVK